MPLHVDLENLPVLRLTYIGDFTDDELRDFLSAIEEALRLPGRKVAMIDLLRATAATSGQRKRQAQWIGANEPQLGRDFAATVIITDRALMRGIVTAIFWMHPLPHPTQVVASLDAATRWLAPHIAKLSDSGGQLI